MSQSLRRLKYNHLRKTGETFDQAVAGLEMQAAENGFRVLHTHNVAATLSEKHFRDRP